MLVCSRCHREVAPDASACSDGHESPLWKVPGESVFGFQLVERLGSEGMAAVYKASRGGESAAIKFLGAGQSLDPALLRRFRGEPKVTQLLSTEIDFVRLLEVREEPAALVMELLGWPTLRELAAKKKLPRVTAVRIARRVARAIQKLHDLDLVHRDLSLDHVFIEPVTFKVKIASAGIVREAAEGKAADPRLRPTPASDVFALGNMLAALLSEQTPPASPPRSGEPELDALVAECLRALPEEYPSCAKLERELRKWEEKAEVKVNEWKAQTAKLELELAPWLHLRARLADVDPEAAGADDPTLAEIARRQAVAAEIAVELAAERGKHGPAVAARAQPATGTGRAATFVIGVLAGVAGLGVVWFSNLGAAPPAVPALVAAPEVPVVPVAAIAAVHDLGVAAAPDMAAPAKLAAAIATVDAGLALGFDPAADAGSACPPEMRFVPGSVGTPGKPSGAIPGFCMDATEVTLGAYEECVAAGKCRRRHSRCDEDGFAGSDPDDCGCSHRDNQKQSPANCLVSSLAAAYCAAHGKELPTKEQWQWALRGAQPEGHLPWGKKWASGRACLGKGKPCAVGQFADGASPQGVLDLVGNVAEWTRDRAANGTSYRDDDGPGVDATAREHIDGTSWSDTIGFRCVMGN